MVLLSGFFWSEADNDKSTDYHHHHLHHLRQTAAAEERTSATATWTHTDALCNKFFPKSPVPFVCCNSFCAMLGKRSLGFDVADVPIGKRLRHNVADISSCRTQCLRHAQLRCSVTQLPLGQEEWAIFSESELQNIIIATC